MSLYLFLFLLITSGSALTILDINPALVNYTAPYLSNTTVLFASFPISLISVFVFPCLIQHPRSEVCVETYNQYPTFSITKVACETNNVSACIYAPRFAEQCRYINTTTACTNAWCYYYTGVGTNTRCANFVPTLPGYQCGPTSYCNQSLVCVDARVDSCNTTLTLSIPVPPPAGAYPLSNSDRVFTTLVVLATGLPALLDPYQYISPGHLPLYSLGNVDPLLSILVDDSEITSQTVPGTLVGLNFLYSTSTQSFDPVRLYPVTYVPVPSMFNLCPGTAIAFVTTEVLINGAGFYNSTSLTCFFENTPVPVLFIDSTRVICSITPLNDTTATVLLEVANDGLSSGLGVGIRILGACDVIKPGSMVFTTTSGPSCECPPGKYDTGSFCQECADGSYQPEVGQSACIPCELSENTRGVTGSVSKSACVCKDGYFYIDGPVCTVCGQGTQCVNGTFSVLEGFWRALNDSYHVIPCPLSVGSPRCEGGVGSSSNLCGEGYEGPLCTVCGTGYGNIGPSRCTKCNGKGADSFLVLLLFILGCLGIIVLIKLTTTNTPGEEVPGGLPPSRKKVPQGGVGSVIKIFMNYIQLVYYIGTLAASWSPSSITFFNIFLPMSISPSFISVKCVSELRFYSRIALVMCLPLLIATALLLIMTLAHLLIPRRWLDRNFVINLYTYVMVMLVILYTIHPMIASSVFASLNCEKINIPGGGTYLSSDMTIDCESPSYLRYRVVAGLYVAGYIFGAPLYTMWRMNKNYAQIQKVLLYTASPHQDSAYRYVYIVRGYKPQSFMWEGVVLFRKLGIVGVAALISGGLQMVWCAAVLVFSMCITVQRMPFSTVLDNRLEIIAHIALTCSVLLAFHSFFLPDSGDAVLSFLILINCSTILLMIAAAFARFREHIHFWMTKVSNLLSFRFDPFSFSFTSTDTSGPIVMYSRNKQTEMQELNTTPPPPPPVTDEWETVEF